MEPGDMLQTRRLKRLSDGWVAYAGVAVLMALGTPANAGFEASLAKLDPETRLEQVCDLAAMDRIAHDKNPYHPDRAKSDVSLRPQHANSTLIVKGGAFRSGGRWYQLAFTCKASPDHMKVLSFTYKIGEEIPEAKWSSYGLWR